MGKALSKRIKCTILFATETGKSEAFAKTLSSIFKYAFDVKVKTIFHNVFYFNNSYY
jgi:hypothetical protein